MASTCIQFPLRFTTLTVCVPALSEKSEKIFCCA